MEKYESKLEMMDLYFSKISFTQNKDRVGEVNLKINHSFEYMKNSIDESITQVIITTKIFDGNGSINLVLVTNGIFKLDDKNLDDTLKDSLLRINTVAIMFPYIRSQIALITAQPGLVSIQIPIVDVNKLVNKAIKN